MKHWLAEYSEKVNADFTSIEVPLLEDTENNAFLNDLIKFPHADVLACCMDRRIKSVRAWNIEKPDLITVKSKKCPTMSLPGSMIRFLI